MRIVIIVAGQSYRSPRRVTVRAQDPSLPHYAVLLPVHKEANMLRHPVTRISRLEYPRERLHALLLIEHDDEETLAAARSIGLLFDTDAAYDAAVSGHLARGGHPLDHVTVVVVAPGGPKTKPNAMNVAMRRVIEAGCEVLTIFDAEDRPDPDQLRTTSPRTRTSAPG